MAILGMTYPARGGLIWDQMRGCYLNLGGLHHQLLISTISISV